MTRIGARGITVSEGASYSSKNDFQYDLVTGKFQGNVVPYCGMQASFPMEHTQNDREHDIAATNDPMCIPVD